MRGSKQIPDGMHKAETDESGSVQVREEQEMVMGAQQPIEVRIADVRRQPVEDGKPGLHMVLLEEEGGERRLPIWIGPFEAEALVMQLEQFETGRPLTYALTAGLLQALAAPPREIRITRLEGDTFHATVIVDGSQGTASVDARPSDALNLAIASGAPVRVDSALFEASASASREPSALRAQMTEGRSAIAADLLARMTRERLGEP